MWVYSTCVWRSQRKGPLELGLQVFVSRRMWMLGANLRSPRSAARALNS